jgi:DNA-binding transcriptional LysR family regulator
VEFRQLRYFVALAEELHYGQAAARLRISKPTLSQQVAVLERSLGVQLLDRRSRSIALTPAGETLLQEARNVLAASERLHKAVAGAGSARPPVDVRVANGLQHALSGTLDELLKDPLMQVVLGPTNTHDAEAAVASGRADAAVVWLPSGEHASLHAIYVGTAAVCMLVPRSHRLARLDSVPVEELADETVALFPRRLSPAVWDRFVEHLLPAGTKPNQLLDAQSADPSRAVADLVATGRAVAPFVRVLAETWALPGVEIRDLVPRLDLPVHVMCREPDRADVRRIVTIIRQDERIGSERAAVASHAVSGIRL